MRRLLALVGATIVLAACGGEDGTETFSVDNARTERDIAPATLTAPPSADPTADTAGADDAATPEDATASDPADAAGQIAGPDTAELRVARAGRWPVGNAGSVAFDVVDGRLVLGDVQAAEGWDAVTEEDDGDEIEVDFRRDAVRWEFEVEIDDGRLEVEIRQDHTDGRDGTYPLLDAGTFTFSRNGGLSLDAIDLADGWTVTEREVDRDEIEFEIREGDRRIDVEVEIDDGRIEVEIDYLVAGPLER
ncbi:MAG TPA: hypothetical protein VK875_06290 [Euzebyales bacterium]|nr:hypothetical protein [Euzebyales bacterium]